MARTFGVVTTFSELGWAEYGSKMVASFLKYFPPEMKLYLYVDFKLKLKNDRLVVRSIPTHCPDLVAFLNRHDIFEFSHGSRVVHGTHLVAHDSSLMWNAKKFSFKVFTSEHAVLNADEQVMIWLDADCVAFDDVPRSLFELTIPRTCMIGYLGRSWQYTESGYVAYNLRHPSTKLFISTMADMYRSGAIYSLKEWHDCEVFDAVRTEFETNLGAETYNISGEISNLDHVFVNSELGRYLDHLKGSRKAEGRSRERDLTRHGDVPYWTGQPRGGSEAEG